MAFYLWRRGEVLAQLDRGALITRFQQVIGPNSLFVFALGLALFWIAVLPLAYPVFEAPPQEPISGHFANMPQLESSPFTLLYWAIALGCLLFPFAVRRLNRTLLTNVALARAIPGASLVLFVAMNFFTHGGLTHNTM